MIAQPSFKLDDGQSDIEPIFDDEHLSEFAHRQAVPHRDLGLPHKAPIVSLQQRPFHHIAPDRVGPIEHNDFDASLSTSLETIQHRPHKRVNSRADVLQVDDKMIEPVEHLRIRSALIRIETVHGRGKFGVVVRSLEHVRLLLSPPTVLRRKNGGQLSGKQLADHLVSSGEPVVHRGAINEQPDAAIDRPSLALLTNESFEANLDVDSVGHGCHDLGCLSGEWTPSEKPFGSSNGNPNLRGLSTKLVPRQL